MNKTLLALLALTFGLLIGAQSVAAQVLQRPPQFVLISFDGSYSHNFWKESLDLAKKKNARFSYFISGVYFLQKNLKEQYQGPRHKAGASDIGFADENPADIVSRVGYVWKALNDGADIGSHVNGHFDGGQWDKAEWTSEFQQFHSLIEGVFTVNQGVTAPYSPQWKPALAKALVGFRAPLLAGNLATQQVLKDFNYLYDASGQAENKWPSVKATGVWDLPLTRIVLAGTSHKTVAMDYNVFYGQCNGKFQKGERGQQECDGLTPNLMQHFENQVYLSYISTYLKAYYGNRAPLSIGHHFSLWNRGLYWRALQRVIYDICSQPETQCVTHKEMVLWMKDMTKQFGPGLNARLNQGDFEKNGTPSGPRDNLKIDLSLLNKVADSNERIPEIEGPAQRMMLKGDLPGAHLEENSVEDLSGFRYEP